VAQGTPIGTTMSAALLVSIGVIPVGGVYNTGTVFQAIRNIQNPGVDYQSAAARDLYSNVDFAEAPFTVAALGLRSGQGDDMVPFIAWGTRTNRVRSDIRRGTKRFAGVSENDVNTNGVAVAGAETVLTALDNFLAAVMNYTAGGNNLTFTPAVFGK